MKSDTWNVIARLGTKGFQTPMWDFNVMLIALSHARPPENHHFNGLDVSEAPNAAEKDAALKTTQLKTVNQKEQLGNPDARVIIEEIKSKHYLLSKYADAYQGISPADFPKFGRFFWELIYIDCDWWYWQSTVKETKYFGGKELILWHSELMKKINEEGTAYIRGYEGWEKDGVVVSAMGALPVTLSNGHSNDTNTAIIIPKDNEQLNAIWCYCSSSQFNKEIRKIDQTLKVTNASLVKIPFDLDYWNNVAKEKYPDGLPKPISDDPTQWLFHGHPGIAEQSLHVAVNRLLGYRWPTEVEAIKGRINKTVTSTEEETRSSTENEDIIKVTGGRGCYDILSTEAKQLIKKVKELELPFDDDGIVCIPPVYNEHPGAERLRASLQKAWGGNWNNNVLAELLRQAGSNKTNLEEWLCDEFFANHCKVFQNRPFIWHIWDGRKDGFSALVNYHKLDKETLKKLIYTYLGDWIRQCEAKKKSGESGADGLLSAALKLKDKLELILVGEKPYDIFVRWKKLEEQPIGWEPDLNDGVRLNIRPFVEAGVLRSRFNIKWGIDRGKNPKGSPWGEVRDNDRHLSLEEKRKARENKL